MRKEITPLTPLENAIKSLEQSIRSLDDLVTTMQKNQQLMQWSVIPGKSIGWVETNED